MDMIDMSVTLIVKAPNQQIEDQTIKCEPTWTIKKLKGYLSEVYPSKPRTEDQKLIYSGQLLSDSVILRDILRWYEGQEAHTVHLVCTPPRDCNRRGSPRPPAKMSERRNSNATEDNSNNSTGTSNMEAVSSDGLRQRLSSGETSVPQPAGGGGSLPDSHLPPPDSGATWAAAMAQPYGTMYDPNNMMQQMALMHQVYAQYMTQYMQMMAAGGTLPPMSPPAQPVAPGTPVAEQPAVPVNNQEPVEAANDINVVDGDDDNRMNRDWLDWFYFMSRLMVLFSIVYFYSSPTRFVIVSALAIMMYLYQVGFFRIQQQQLQVARVAAENNNVPVDARPVDNNNVEANEGEDVPRGNQEAVSEAGEPAQEPDRPSLLAVTWTFFTSFFASLIPEQPGAI
ncbi:Homocysteine-responsive endoplasmic reticulum-resident ubiquitin-like domain member 2 protein [Gryllus bimaculatus]|nr:Homocysteine-responsive endoplasmic reticulum-resident ubiquitin-like domain member 2 protein [Gryllus bimaculatus]